MCRICSAVTENENLLKIHFKSTHPESSPYQCPICKVEFDTTSAEHKHRMSHTKNGDQFTCVICSAKFCTYKNLYFHYSKDHVEQSESICKICNITFPNQMTLDEHNYVRHKSKNRFKCIFCPKVYNSSVQLTVHLKTHNNKIVKCKICYRPFTDTASLFQHMLFHASTLGTERPLKCALCLTAYAKESALKYHILRHFTKDSLFNCLICGETLSDYDSTCEHIFDHSIRITENNMSERETAWIDIIKETTKKRQSAVLRGRPPRKSSNNDPDFKLNIGMKSDKTGNEESFLNRGRGRPRKLPNEKPETNRERKRRQSADGGASIVKTVATKISNIHDNHTPRRRRISIEQPKTENILRRNNLKRNRIPTNSKAKTNNVIKKNYNQVKQNENEEVSKVSYDPQTSRIGRRNKVSKVSYVPQTSRVGRRNKVRAGNQFKPAVQYPEANNDIPTTKVRPMSFKRFSSLTNKRATKMVNKELRYDILAKEELPVETTSLVDLGILDVKEEMFDYDEDPLDGIEIPHISENKNLDSSSNNFEHGSEDLECQNVKKGKKSKQYEPNQFDEDESINSNGCIQETKCFEPSLVLTKYSCTTCHLSFSSHKEFKHHNTGHVLSF